MRFLLLAGLLLLIQGGYVLAQFEDDVDEEPDGYEYRQKQLLPEAAIIIPSWPALTDRIEVKLGLDDFPFTLWIDPASISVDRARVVRYTAILKSAGAAANVFYEAIDCTEKSYRRYAYGSAGRFRQVRDSRWMRIVPRGMGRFRDVLMQNHVCPVAGKKPVDRLIRRLRSDPAALLTDQQEE